MGIHTRAGYADDGGSADTLSERLYRLAVRHQTISVDDAARAVGHDSEAVVSALRTLVDLGLLQVSLDAEETYLPVLPQTVQARLIAPVVAEAERCQREYEAVQARLAAYLAIHDEAIRMVDHSGQTQVLMGLPLINNEITRTVRNARHEVLTAQPGGGRSRAALEAAWRDTEPTLQRGVRMRTVYQHSARFSAATRQYVERATAAGAQTRTAAGSFQRIIIVDREVAFIPVRDDRLAAAAVREPTVVNFLVNTYDQIWESSLPFETGRVSANDREETVSEIRMEIIRLLAAGYTDEAIANRIGLGVRSCRGHIAKIYEQYAARSRFHLGMLIAESGILRTQG